MLDITISYSEAEDLILAFQRTMASLRDNLTELELLLKRIIEGQVFIDKEDCWEEVHKKSVVLTGKKFNATVHFGHYSEIVRHNKNYIVRR